MVTIPVSDFNLKSTLESGQIFRYRLDDGGFYRVVVGDSIVRLRQIGGKIECDANGSGLDITKFLGLNHDYGRILSSINRDRNIAKAIENHRGLRILEQDVWECTASFICSAFSNIPRISQCIEKVSSTFGSSVEFGGFKTFSFPQPEQIDSFPKLKKCGLGYRDKYLFEAARIFASRGGEYSRLQLGRLSYGDAKRKIMEVPGVGSKVADCVLLFSCGFYEAFPVDVWIRRVMETAYGSRILAAAAARNVKPSERVVADFARSYFGEYAGYAQQFLYHNARAIG